METNRADQPSVNRTTFRGLFRVKPLDAILEDAEEPEHQLKRALGPVQLTLFGVGAIIGAGIFATIGTAAAGDANLIAVGEPVDLGSDSPAYPQVVGGATVKYVTANNGLVQVWHFDLDHYRTMACQLAGRNMSQEEWKRYGPANTPYHATCPQWPDG
jgi:hypothetical protein